ncbi:unnamed protein product [Brugia pahangi]|uniref:CS domain-containing protein n=1 Tax=Brugia pahangi TaxID=6280 RepID=A0A0N4TDI8_BRUPA|nr:unnamed protein product [Brugia pahangi]
MYNLSDIVMLRSNKLTQPEETILRFRSRCILRSYLCPGPVRSLQNDYSQWFIVVLTGFTGNLSPLLPEDKTMVRVFVKWGKERFEVEANMNDSPLQLKSQLFSLTGVNPDRQKVLIKVSQIFCKVRLLV